MVQRHLRRLASWLGEQDALTADHVAVRFDGTTMLAAVHGGVFSARGLTAAVSGRGAGRSFDPSSTGQLRSQPQGGPMSIPMFISAAIVAAAVFIAVRTVRRRQQGAAGPAAYGGPPPPSVADRRLARRNAKVPYQGRPEDEPHVAHALQALGSHLTHLYRADEAVLRQARQQDVAAQGRVLWPTPPTNGRALPPAPRAPSSVAPASAPPPTTRRKPPGGRPPRPPAPSGPRRRSCSCAAARSSSEAARLLRTAETRAIDALAAAAAAGLVPINGYLAAYNQARTAEGSRRSACWARSGSTTSSSATPSSPSTSPRRRHRPTRRGERTGIRTEHATVRVTAVAPPSPARLSNDRAAPQPASDRHLAQRNTPCPSMT